MLRSLPLLFLVLSQCFAESEFDDYANEHVAMYDQKALFLVSIFSESNSCERIVIYDNNDYVMCTHMINWADQGGRKGNSLALKVAIENALTFPLKHATDAFIPQTLISQRIDGKVSVHWVSSNSVLVHLIRLTSR